MNGMTEIMPDAFLLQVRYQVVDVFVGRGLEGTTGREMDIPCNLVDAETTGDVATLVRLFLQFVCPAFFYTLLSPIKLVENLVGNAPTWEIASGVLKLHPRLMYA